MLSSASLEGCYLDTLLSVIADAFEEIDSFCDKLPQKYELGWIRAKARLGLNITYMAQDKAGAVKRITDDIEKELWRGQTKAREAQE
jgi:hypothetical protein